MHTLPAGSGFKLLATRAIADSPSPAKDAIFDSLARDAVIVRTSSLNVSVQKGEHADLLDSPPHAVCCGVHVGCRVWVVWC